MKQFDLIEMGHPIISKDSALYEHCQFLNLKGKSPFNGDT